MAYINMLLFSLLTTLACKQGADVDYEEQNTQASSGFVSSETAEAEEPEATEPLALVEFISFGEDEGILIMHPEFYKSIQEQGDSAEDVAAATAYLAGKFNSQLIWDELSDQPVVDEQQLGLNPRAADLFYKKSYVKKKAVAVPSKVRNLIKNDVKPYFYGAIGRKFDEINELSVTRGDVTKKVRGFDVLERNPRFTVGGRQIELESKGQIILGHMPDRAIVMDMQMSLAAVNLLKSKKLIQDDYYDDDLLRMVSTGKIDPTDYGITLDQIVREISDNVKIREYAILRQFELDRQNAYLGRLETKKTGIGRDQSELIRRNDGNWKQKMVSGSGPNGRAALAELERLTKIERDSHSVLHATDRSTITDAAGFSKLVRDYADAVDRGSVTYVHCKSGQGRSATVAAGLYLERVIRQLKRSDIENLKEKDLHRLIDDAIAVVENPHSGRIQAKISGQQRPVLEEFVAKRLKERLKEKSLGS